jgi:serine/threonine-protein kinase RsbW
MQSRRDAVAPTVERIIAATAGAGLSAEQLDSLAVACAEALSNAAVHGNRLRAGRLVRVAVAVRPGACVVVEVQDSGSGFDTAAITDPTEPGRLLTPGGRGVFLMRRLVDRVEYSASGSRVRLVMERRPHRRKDDRR